MSIQDTTRRKGGVFLKTLATFSDTAFRRISHAHNCGV